MRDAVLEPLCEVPGTGRKLWSMILAELLLGAGGDRERWTAAGSAFTVVDTLVHATLCRTGLIERYGKAHPYGSSCWASGGCAEIIEHIADQIDARHYAADNPRVFPRLIARALWGLGAEGELAICNARRIDDQIGCRQRWCPAHQCCAHRPLRSALW